tara:strand:+ start:133766 stop:134833 length:1068 start_codon:yes stop_codon:yes gene_type:complete
MIKRRIVVLVLMLLTSVIGINAQTATNGKWSIEKAENWYKQYKWLNGADFVPSTAINQLEMWQEDTFDPETIDRELGYAQGIGMNVMRVYLHSLAYKQDPKGFKKRLDQYLDISNKRGIKTMFVFFDDVWSKTPKIGKQPEPKPGTHNSGWIQDPGDPASYDEANFPALEVYVKDILKTFANDNRVLLWDLYNEPGNEGKGNKTLPLLKKVFQWAREINPSQPISAGIWAWNLVDLNAFQALNSDIITYHHYGNPEEHKLVIELLKSHGRPMICTEYMARTRNSRFSNIMPILKAENVGAINWGLVNGKSNTIYQWNTPIDSGEEPIEWFHDIFRKDGTPYRQDEVDLIKKMNSL